MNEVASSAINRLTPEQISFVDLVSDNLNGFKETGREGNTQLLLMTIFDKYAFNR